MDKEEQIESTSQLKPEYSTTTLITQKDVATEMKEWIKRTEKDQDSTKSSYANTIEYIELKLEHRLSYFETTWFERQYVKTILQLWLENSLKTAFKHFDNEEYDISREMSAVLIKLNNINSFEDIRSVLKVGFTKQWCDRECRYLKLILEQKDLFKNTPQFAVSFNCYFNQFKTSCIEKVFSRCLSDIVKDETHCKKHKKFIVELNKFLCEVNKEKNLQDVMEKEEFVGNYVIEESKTGQDIVKKLGEMFSCVNDEMSSKIPEWLQSFLSIVMTLNENEWTKELNALTKETCKIFFLPKTEIELKEEDGKQIIAIKGIAIFVSKMIEDMKRLKFENPNIEEIKIVGLKSVHIDCDLNNETWHGINIGIVTEKLVVEGTTNEDYTDTSTGLCYWDVSGINAIPNITFGETPQSGENGGNVHVVCRKIINGQKWTIVSDGGDGSAGYKCTKEEFEDFFLKVGKWEMQTVLTTLNQILPNENRKYGKDIMPGHMNSFFIKGTTVNGSEITAKFYEEKNYQGKLLLIKGSHVGQGRYGGDITIECINNAAVKTSKNSSKTCGLPFTGKNINRKLITTVRIGVYKASGTDGKIGKVAGDVAYIHNYRKKDIGCEVEQIFYGFDRDQKIKIQLKVDKEDIKTGDRTVKYEEKKFARLVFSKLSTSNSPGIVVDVAKKKAVIRQSLVQHCNQIDEWKQLIKGSKKMLSEPNEDHSKNVDEIMKEIEKVDQFKTQRQWQQFEKMDQEQYVKQAIDSSSQSFLKPKMIGRHPVFSTDCSEKSLKKVNCLDVLPTEDGIDSALHCLLGHLNSEGKYVCKDTKGIRKIMAKKFRKKFHIPKTYRIIGKYVLKNFPKAISKSKENMKPIVEKYQQLKEVGTQNQDYNFVEFFSLEDDAEWVKLWVPCDNDTRYISLKLEYSNYIESAGTLGLAELEILAEVLKIRIHVYLHHVYEHHSSYFQYFQTLNPLPNKTTKVQYDEYFIQYDGNGRWKKLSPNYNLEIFCKKLTAPAHITNTSTFAPKNEQKINQIYYEQLKSWIEGYNNINKMTFVITAIEKFNPQNKTPDKLSQLLLSRLNNLNNDVEQTEKFISAISSLTEWVEYYNNRNINPFFYLHILEDHKPDDWEFRFILLELEERLEKPFTDNIERENWIEIVRKNLISHQSLLAKIAIENKKESEILFSLDVKTMLPMLECLEEKSNVTRSNVGLDNKNFNSGKTDTQLTTENEWKSKSKKTLNLSNNKAEEILDDNFVAGHNLTLESRNVKAIIDEMKRKYSKDKRNILNVIENIENILKLYERQKIEFEDIFKIILEKKGKNAKVNYPEQLNISKLMTEMKKLGEKHSDYKRQIQSFINDGLDINDDTSLTTFLCIFDHVVKQKLGFELYDTQRVAIMTLLVNHKTFAQVSTGEGKSIIVAGLAIGFALSDRLPSKDSSAKRNLQIDVITSNDVLAIRDSYLPVSEGGLKELYDFFNVTVGNNCSRSVDDRKKIYYMDVVYGTLANFQRDYLLDEFYNHNIRGNRKMAYGIIDEVDSVLLDCGNNMLYLSHDIPGMEMFEFLYVFIWEKTRDTSAEMIKSEILYDLYGQITEIDLNNIYTPLAEEELASERSAIWEHLIRRKVINPQGRLEITDASEITEEKIDYLPTNGKLEKKILNPKMVFYFRKIAERKRRIHIPDHLLRFVDRHLDTWLDNARRAEELKKDVDYVIDHDRSDTRPDLNPQVIIIDPDTGTDQYSSQWDGALHQFLQLKEGCKLTLQSLKAVFISNATYIKKYNKILVGVSGTLGSLPEYDFLKKQYNCDFITVPTAYPKRFSLKPSKLFQTKESWRRAIIEETRETIRQKRSVIVFCQSIKEVNEVHKQLKYAIKEIKENNNRIHRYTRDYEKFKFENSKLDVGHVIVATNLAGRGTDIKISKNLETNGGLHVCLTYFLENERVEEQAMGRAARKGEPGSGILILCEEQTEQLGESSTNEELGAEKIFFMKEERECKKRQRILRLGKDLERIEMLEKLFESVTEFRLEKKAAEKEYIKTMNGGNNLDKYILNLLDKDFMLKLIHYNALDNWALWLDETDYNFKCFHIKKNIIMINLYWFKENMLKWMMPTRRIIIAKHLADAKSKSKLSHHNGMDPKEEASEILHKLMNSTDKIIYPAAFYYKAFILLAQMNRDEMDFKKKKTEFIRTLRHAETILNLHNYMQIYFKLIHESKMKPNHRPLLCPVDGYREQKQNNIIILQYFINSIQFLLGNSYFSAWDLQQVLGQLEKNKEEGKHSKKTEEEVEDHEQKTTAIRKRAEQLFQSLISSKCIVWKVNNSDTVPNYKDSIKIIASKYNIERFLLEDTITSVFEKCPRDAKETEKELEKEKLISCSRKAFWTTLVNAGALNNAENCIVIEDSELVAKLDRRERIEIPFNFVSDGYVQYKPKYFSQKDLEIKMIMFPKYYVKDNLSKEEYLRSKPKFESNKIAQIDFKKLETVDLKAFGRLTKDRLRHANFTPTERQVIWEELRKQEIISDQGFHLPLAPEFKYPDCPVYEDTIRCLIKKTFPAELVRRSWLELEPKDKSSTEYIQNLKMINLLPEKPYRKLLGRLMEAHVISGVQVTEEMGLDVLEKEVKKITKDKNEFDCILNILNERRADYVAEEMKPDNVTLECIEGKVIQSNMNSLSSELQVFWLVGFDHFIGLKSRNKSWLTRAKAITTIIGGLVQCVVGVAINYCPIIDKLGSLLGDLTKTGLDDIYFGIKALKSPYDLMFYYREHKIESLKESGGLLGTITSLAKKRNH
ncbi:uncharacterized protein LOC124189951 [Daphnia pulex]|uniref:uncharacterized protein LOC124189951 n=1 Tax=Daphnia pulex TaxID=6669 RepID=UPI001EE03594|nr:uncharacterized protein LOC124189951 [Daphnia pulex]XP_046438422.1 uncharacterized protein LOC124189951 [Daphnia pulex]XP_046438423.1 uncharacterized protein LOC124189951 [Daphnia pulex]